MSNQTKIEWADSTFNPWMGCTKVSPACDHCYAERDTKRFGRVEWGAGKPRVRTVESNWRKPKQWNVRADTFRECASCGWRGDLADRRKPLLFACPSCSETNWTTARRRVFCASLADWLDNEAPIEWLVDLLDLIRRTPNLDWLLLTKRVGNFRKRMQFAGLHAQQFRSDDTLWQWIAAWRAGDVVPPNVWMGATVVNQDEADRDVPKLLAVPARVRFLSIEPMLGPITLNATLEAPFRQALNVDWIICGGESGPHARPMHPDWVGSLRDQCAAAGVPFLFKQWGEWAPPETCGEDIPEALRLRTGEGAHVFPGDLQQMGRIGKKAAGRQLDGRTHDGFPGGAA